MVKKPNCANFLWRKMVPHSMFISCPIVNRKKMGLRIFAYAYKIECLYIQMYTSYH